MQVKQTIKQEDEILIKAAFKAEKKVSVKDRLHAILLHMQGRKKQEISKILNKNHKFAGHCIKRYLSEGLEGLKEKRGTTSSSSYLNNEQKKELFNIINISCPISQKGWNGKLIVDLIEKLYNKKYHKNSIYSLLKSLNLSCKIATKVDPKKSEEKIAIWKEDIKKIS